MKMTIQIKKKCDQRVMSLLCLTSACVLLVTTLSCNDSTVIGESGESATNSNTSKNWVQFRGANGTGVSSETGIPAKWDTKTNVVWKTPLPGPGSSSPITWGDRIFVTCQSGYGLPGNRGNMDDLKRHLICLDRKSGKVLWNETIDSLLPEQPFERRMPLNGYASSTPVVDDDRVYSFFGKTGVFAHDHQGKQLWKASVGTKIHGWGSAASPVLYENLLIVNACIESQSMVALDKKTGEEVWRVRGIRQSWNTPLLVDVSGRKTELAVAIFGKVIGYDPKTGKELWSCDAHREYVAPSMIAHEGVLYCTAGRGRKTVAIKAGGTGDVSQTHLLWRSNKGSNVSSPVYKDGHLYFAHDVQGILFCLNAKTGETVYEQRLSPNPGTIYASALLADGKVFYISRYGAIQVVAAKPEYELIATNSMNPDRFFNAAPIVSQGQLLLRSDTHLYCIAEEN